MPDIQGLNGSGGGGGGGRAVASASASRQDMWAGTQTLKWEGEEEEANKSSGPLQGSHTLAANMSTYDPWPPLAADYYDNAKVQNLAPFFLWCALHHTQE